jgi:hypothetical protein
MAGSDFHGYSLFNVRIGQNAVQDKFTTSLEVEHNGNVRSSQFKLINPKLILGAGEFKKVTPEKAAENLSSGLRRVMGVK